MRPVHEPMTRKCGSCTLCCKLLPVKELKKPSNTKCKHQHFGGCRIYHQRPPSCRIWSCAWLTDPDASELRRPDKTHYVVDPSPDFIHVTQDGESMKFPVLQIWVDKRYPEAHEDPVLREILNSRGIIALIRYDSHNGFVIIPPSRSQNGQWNYKKSDLVLKEHTPEEIARVMEN